MKNDPTYKSLFINVKVDKEGIESEMNSIKEKMRKAFDMSIDGTDKFLDAFDKSNRKRIEELRKFELLTERRKDIQTALKGATGEDKKTLKAALKEIENVIKKSEVYKEKRREENMTAIKNVVDNKLSNIKDSITRYFTEILNNVKEYFDKMASYNVSGSIFGTGVARETMLQWGTNEAQSFAFSRTRDILGLTSDEDLWYMNENQRQKFAELIGRYTSKYQELANKDFFKSYEEFKLEWTLFKEDLTYDLMGFIIQNKDTLKQFLELGVESMKSTIKFFGWVTGSNVKAGSSVSDIMNSYSNNISNKSEQYAFNNVFNVTDLTSPSAIEYASNFMNAIKQLKNS